MTNTATDVTDLLYEWSAGDPDALEKLMPLVYMELRRLARRALRREGSAHTFDSGVLVNELYLKLVRQERANWPNRKIFFCIAAQLMRRILIDYSRSKAAGKRPPLALRKTLNEEILGAEGRDVELIDLDIALSKLKEIDPRQAEIVELHSFVGLSLEEVAETLGVSPTLASNEWRFAKAWLRRELEPDNTTSI